MNNLRKALLILVLCLNFSSMPVIAEVTKAGEGVSQYVHEGRKYPAALFQTNIESESFKVLFNSYNAFEKLEGDAVGSPIGIRVLKALKGKPDAAGITSVLLAAGTLGIVPTVISKDFKVRYEVFVQGNVIAKYEYEMTSTDVGNLWAGPRQAEEIKPAEEAFLNDSVGRFLTELKQNKEAQQLFDEYFTYYSR